MNKERYLVVLSGPSGTGKDTVVSRLMELHDNIELSVSATTREMREGEQEGVNYYYKSIPEFEEMIRNGKILEYTLYCDNYYGTPRDQVEARLEQKTTVVLVIEVEGGHNVKKIYPDCTTVFVNAPSFEELERRLRSRATDSEEAILKRLDKARAEIAAAEDYDYHIVNDDLDSCVEELYRILVERQA